MNTFEQKQAAKILAAYLDPEQLANLEKGSGEGSRGGTVIGHTKSGKPIYADHNHPSHEHYNAADHEDAAEVHGQLVDEDDDEDPHFEGFMHHNSKAEEKSKKP